jgi:tRNA (guanine6-N2)-methyltransferase
MGTGFGNITGTSCIHTCSHCSTGSPPISIHEWDARQLPLDAGSVTAPAVNLPFGAQVGSVEENRDLYPAFLREAVRVLRPGARCVALSGDVRTLGDALRRNNRLVRRATYPVIILGRRVAVVVAENK